MFISPFKRSRQRRHFLWEIFKCKDPKQLIGCLLLSLSTLPFYWFFFFTAFHNKAKLVTHPPSKPYRISRGSCKTKQAAEAPYGHSTVFSCQDARLMQRAFTAQCTLESILQSTFLVFRSISVPLVSRWGRLSPVSVTVCTVSGDAGAWGGRAFNDWIEAARYISW